MANQNKTELSHEELQLVLAETEKTLKEAKLADLDVQMAEMSVQDNQLLFKLNHSTDFGSGYFEFNCDIDEDSVPAFCASFRKYSRIFPKKPIVIELNSGGGSIIDGFAMFDEILRLRREGHHITVRVRGNAASMACVLLQAADKREMGANSFLMIHRASFGAMGSAYEVEDSLDFVKKLEGRIINIFMERTGRNKKMFTDFFKQRKDLWFDADEALKAGLIDEVI